MVRKSLCTQIHAHSVPGSIVVQLARGLHIDHISLQKQSMVLFFFSIVKEYLLFSWRKGGHKKKILEKPWYHWTNAAVHYNEMLYLWKYVTFNIQHIHCYYCTLNVKWIHNGGILKVKYYPGFKRCSSIENSHQPLGQWMTCSEVHWWDFLELLLAHL